MDVLLNTSLVKEKGIVRGRHISYMFARLFIGSSLPDYVSKVIYIDCDTLYIGNVSELYNTEIESRYIFAAVRDMWPSSYNEAIGLKSDDLYFQSGIMLVDLAKWRRLHCEKKILESAIKAKHYYFMHDQDLLNICFKGEIQTLSPKYGMIYLLRHYSPQECIWFSGKNESHYYTISEINEAKADIHVIHYAGDYFGRPWSFPKACKDNMHWLEYYLKTPWANEAIGNKHSFEEWTKYIIKKMAYPFVDSLWLKKTKRRFEDVNQDMINTMKED